MPGKLTIDLFDYELKFAFKARTSRGRMQSNKVIIIKISHENKSGWGEINSLPGLSLDDSVDYHSMRNEIEEICNNVNLSTRESVLASVDSLVPLKYSALRMALETAILDLISEEKNSIFGKPIRELKINGLVWMGDSTDMLRQVTEKIRDGFTCIKLKVGGIHFDDELDIIQYIRRKYFRENLMIRLDANGAFSADTALFKLEELNKFDIHSIEQPLEKGSNHYPDIVKQSPIPVALDEELIGTYNLSEKKELLEKINPAFLVLKPSLHGGFTNCIQWISLAEEMKKEWWITSALESNIGLNAITAFVSQYENAMHQGLGTGKIYDNNITSPLEQYGEFIRYNLSKTWDYTSITS